MENKAKKLRFNILDFIIVILVVALIAGAAVRYDLGRKVGLQSRTDHFIVAVLVENIQQTSPQYIIPDADVFFEANGARMGAVREVISNDPAATYVENENGDIVKSYLIDRRDVTFSIACDGVKTADGYMINGTSVAAAGKQYKIHTSGLEVSATILSVSDAQS